MNRQAYPEESQRAHPAIGNNKCTQHTMDVKCTYIYSVEMISQTNLIHSERNAELVLKEMENDHRAYRLVYRMASQETVEITTKR